AYRTAAVARGVGGDPEQPRSQRSLRIEAGQRPVRRDQCVLCDIFGLVRISTDEIREAEHRLLMPLHELLVCACIAPLRRTDKLGIHSVLLRLQSIHHRRDDGSRADGGRRAAFPVLIWNLLNFDWIWAEWTGGTSRSLSLPDITVLPTR